MLCTAILDLIDQESLFPDVAAA